MARANPNSAIDWKSIALRSTTARITTIATMSPRAIGSWMCGPSWDVAARRNAEGKGSAVQFSSANPAGRESRAQVATDTSAWGDSAIGLTPLARSGAEVVGASGLQAGPLGGGTSIGTGNLLAFKPLWPAGRRVLPRLLAPVDGQVEQPVAVIHRLDAASRRPVSLEDLGSLSQVANDVHHAHPASNQERVERVLGRVPRHLPAHEVAVPGALFVRALAKRGVGDVARMNIGQLADLRCNPGAPLALLRRRVAGVPHEVVGDEHPASLERVEQRHRAMWANQLRGRIDFHHRQPSTGCCDRVTLVRVSLFSNPQCVKVCLEGAPIDYSGRFNFVSLLACCHLFRSEEH